MAWVIEDGSYPYQDTLGELIPVLDNENPPIGFWSIGESINNGYPHLITDKTLLPILDTRHLPTGFFTITNDEYPKFAELNPVNTGAFCGMTNLTSITIPKNVKYIGMTAFRDTSLMYVTIAKDCKYYPTSFPDGCTVNFYED